MPKVYPRLPSNFQINMCKGAIQVYEIVQRSQGKGWKLRESYPNRVWEKGRNGWFTRERTKEERQHLKDTLYLKYSLAGLFT